MKIGELLRQLADALDAEGISTDDDDDSLNGEIMVSPLQQTLELLKKSTGVENDVDTFAEDDPAEIARLQQMAGITQQAAPNIINQTTVIHTGDSQPPVETPTPEPEVSTVSVVPMVAKPLKQITPENNYANISENDDCIIDIGDSYHRLREEFEMLSGKKGRK